MSITCTSLKAVIKSVLIYYRKTINWKKKQCYSWKQDLSIQSKVVMSEHLLIMDNNNPKLFYSQLQSWVTMFKNCNHLLQNI